MGKIRASSSNTHMLKPGGRVILSVDNKWALQNILDPLSTPPLAPMRHRVGKFLDWSGLRRKRLRPHDYSYSIRRFDRLVENAGLEKAEGITVGFGPFSFLGLELPQSWGLALHRGLQGSVYVTVAKKGSANA